MKPTTEPEIGQRVYSYGENGDGQPMLWNANYVHKHGTWRRYRNTATGKEWNENGLRWWITIGQALAAYVDYKACVIYREVNRDRVASHIRRIVRAVEIARQETQRIRR